MAGGEPDLYRLKPRFSAIADKKYRLVQKAIDRMNVRFIYRLVAKVHRVIDRPAGDFSMNDIVT